ncbi:MAG: sarcosine oxidase subunit gamma [Alphaproteobacteria bacterium]
MPETYLRQSPLAHLHLDARAVVDPGDADLVLSERRFTGKVNLRGKAEDEGFRAAVQSALGFEVPVEANAVTGARNLDALWLGPDEWLIATPPGEEGRVAAKLERALQGRHAAVTDVSEARTVIRVSGPRARDVLMKGCSLDLHLRVFGPGRCAQSAVAKAQVILHQTDELPTFDLYVDRSFAEYLWLWLEDAAAEYKPVIMVDAAPKPPPRRKTPARPRAR